MISRAFLFAGLIISVLLPIKHTSGMDDSSGSEDGGNGGESSEEDSGIPVLAPLVGPNIPVVEKPEFFDVGNERVNNRPIPLPVAVQNPFPPTSDIVSTFPSDPPMQGPPRQTDSSNNWPVRTSAIKGPQPPSRWMHTAVVLQNRLVVWGGIANDAASLNDLWVYSYNDAEWTQLERPMASNFPTRPGEGTSDHTDAAVDLLGRPPTIPVPFPMMRPPGTPREESTVAGENSGGTFDPSTIKILPTAPPPATEPLASETESITDLATRSDLYPDAPSSGNGGSDGSSSFLELQTRLRHRVRSRQRVPMSALMMQPRGSAYGEDDGLFRFRGSAASTAKNVIPTFLPTTTFYASTPFPRPAMWSATSTATPTRPTHFAVSNGEGQYSMHAQSRSDVWAFNIDKREWQQPDPAPEEPSARWMHSAVVNEKVENAHGMVIFGGCNNTAHLMNDVWEFKYPSSWSLLWPQTEADLKDGPSPREGHAAALGTKSYSESKAASEMYVFGGIDLAYVPFNETWMFDLSSKKWTNLTEDAAKASNGMLPPARWMHTLTPVKGGTELILFGGCSKTFGPLDDTWRFVVKDKRWELVAPDLSFPPPARWLHTANAVLSGGSVIEEYVIVFGGTANNAHMDDMWLFSVKDGSWFEDYPSSDFPMARAGHTTTLFASAALRKTMKTATKEAISASSSSRRRLLTVESLPFVQTPIDYEKLKAEKSMPPYNPVEKAQTDELAKATDFVSTQRSSDSNFWLAVFGGRGERGAVASASSTSGSLY